MSSGWILPAEGERERALLAVAEIWGEHGYEGLSAQAIAARAGIEPETFVEIFGDIEAAAIAAIEMPLAAVVSIVSDLYSPDRSEAESYALAIVSILELMAANPAYTFLVCIAGRHMAPPRVHGIYESGHQLLVAMLERLWASSDLAEQPARAGLAALGAAEAVARREILANRYERLPVLAPDFVYSAITPFLGQEEGMRLAREARDLPSGSAVADN